MFSNSNNFNKKGDLDSTTLEKPKLIRTNHTTIYNNINQITENKQHTNNKLNSYNILKMYYSKQ